MDGNTKSFNFLHALIIFITIVLLGFFLVFLTITLNYFKTVALTIKIILRAAFESKSPFLAYKEDIKTIKHTKLREEVEKNMLQTQSNFQYFTRWTVILDRWSQKGNNPYDQSGKTCKNYNLLEPPAVLYSCLYAMGVILVWLWAGLFTSLFSTSLLKSMLPGVILIPILVSLVATAIIIVLSCSLHYIYLINVRAAFK